MSEIVSGDSAFDAPIAKDQQSMTRLSRFLLLAVELVMVTAIVRLFEIEQDHSFFPVLCLVVVGFGVQAWLPRTYQRPFFAILSIVCLLFVLGLANGFAVLAIGAVLIGLCHVPLSLRAKYGLMAGVVVILVGLRDRLPLPFWPVVGSMFMFRLALYFHELRHSRERPSLTESVSYLFMLPNVCFPFFPVVDCRTFRECWYAEDDYETYQRGITWIVRGIVHLLLYRYISSHLVPDAYELYDVPHLSLFMVTNYALYLRVSGQFHMITGILHLFGFDLPRTHHNFFLASSFTDIWRRINIYWKDFMMKLFFLPTFYTVRGRGASLGVATVVGVFCVFVLTWLLHSWQTFWLRGSFPVNSRDALLWLGAGTCVSINALLETSRRRKDDRPIWWQAISRSVQTVSMFWLISLFWACWTRPDFPMLVRGAIARPDFFDGLLAVSLWSLIAVVVGTMIGLLRHRQLLKQWFPPRISFRDVALLHAVGLGGVLAVASPRFSEQLPVDVARTMTMLRSSQTERGGLDQLPGYYEDLNATVIQAGPFISGLSPQDETLRAKARGFQKVSRRADIYQAVELIPGIQTELEGSPFTVNQFSMRDRATITLHKSPKTIRIAMVGSSVIMGSGVSDDEVFSRVFEDRLNAQPPDPHVHYEVLNFGVGKQWASHRLVRLQRQVLGFQPDAIYYFAHQDEFASLDSHIATLVNRGVELPSPFLKEVVDQAGITPGMAPGAVQVRLSSVQDELLSAVYRAIVNECVTRDILPVWIYLPIPTAGSVDIAEQVVPLAEDAGFVVCNLQDWAAGRAMNEILRTPDDPHAHAAGHQTIASVLLKMIEDHPEALP